MTATGGTGVTVTLLIHFSILQFVNSFQLNLLDYANDIENDDNTNTDGGIPSPDYCSDNYPYTFSKCLRLCSSDLNNVTCLDDQLCYCNTGSNELKDLNSSLNSYLGANPKVTCHFSDFCEDLCKYDEKLSGVVLESHGAKTATGALCNIHETGDDEIESCVCGL